MRPESEYDAEEVTVYTECLSNGPLLNILSWSLQTATLTFICLVPNISKIVTNSEISFWVSFWSSDSPFCSRADTKVDLPDEGWPSKNLLWRYRTRGRDWVQDWGPEVLESWAVMVVSKYPLIFQSLFFQNRHHNTSSQSHRTLVQSKYTTGLSQHLLIQYSNAPECDAIQSLLGNHLPEMIFNYLTLEHRPSGMKTLLRLKNPSKT